MQLKTKLNRRQLALRLFAIALIINGALLLCLLPESEVAAESKSLPTDMVELRVKATLLTSFTEHRSVMLSQETGRPIGPVLLVKQEDDGLIIAITESLYRLHHQRLVQENWVALPYLEGLLKSPSAGVNYEIAY